MMSVEIKNEYGKIFLDEDLVASIAGFAAGENYGIVGMSPKSTGDSLIELIRKDNLKRGINVSMVESGVVDIELYVTLEYGVSLPAVAQNARDNVRYRVEDLTGLKVRNVNIYVEKIRV